MEIKSSLSLLRKIFKGVGTIGLCFFLAACQTFEVLDIKTRDQIEEEKKSEESQEPTEEVVGKTSEDLNKKLFNIKDENVRPKLGLILGPGMALSLSHLGVLKALNDQKLPIEAIAGVGWSSLIAANYAINGAVNDMTWKANQGRFNMDVGKGFLRGEIKETPEEVIASLIEQYTRGQSISRSRIDYICPALDVQRARNMYFKSGTYQRALLNCMKVPPLTQNEERVWAQLTDIESLAQQMRSMGVQKVIYINVLPTQGGLNWGKNAGAVSARDKYLWAQIQRTNSLKPTGVDHILQINNKGADLLDFKNVRSMINQSAGRADQFFRNLAREYSF